MFHEGSNEALAMDGSNDVPAAPQPLISSGYPAEACFVCVCDVVIDGRKLFGNTITATGFFVSHK